MKFLAALFLIFLTLKLLGVITWSWWLVCLPLIGAVLLPIIVFVAGLIGIAWLLR